MKIFKLGTAVALSAMLAACAQQEEPRTMVSPEPVFDKYGGGSCEEGYIYQPGTAYQPPVCEEDCDAAVDSTGAPIPCPPPSRRPHDDDDDSSSGGRTTPGTPSTGSAPVT